MMCNSTGICAIDRSESAWQSRYALERARRKRCAGKRIRSYVRMYVRPLDKTPRRNRISRIRCNRKHEVAADTTRESRDIGATALHRSRDERVFSTRLLSCASICTFIFRNDARAKRADRAHGREIAIFSRVIVAGAPSVERNCKHLE